MGEPAYRPLDRHQPYRKFRRNDNKQVGLRPGNRFVMCIFVECSFRSCPLADQVTDNSIRLDVVAGAHWQHGVGNESYEQCCTQDHDKRRRC